MKVGIVITCYNRANLTRIALNGLRSTEWPSDSVLVMLVDDCSTEPEAVEVFESAYLPDVPVIKVRHAYNYGIKKTLLDACEELFLRYNCDVVTNLDNDVILKPEWLRTLLKLQKEFPFSIVTGFHSTTRNANGTERHIILERDKDYCVKKSVGGINMMFSRNVYADNVITPLMEPVGNWDHMASLNCEEGVVCAIPSVIQHTGVQVSSLGHVHELPDTADDFYLLDLPDVTLIGVDNVNIEGLRYAAQVSQLQIRFGDVVLLHEPSIQSKELYSRFIIRELHKYVKTSHCLIIQHDGYVINPQTWDPQWLKTDYIGATWLFKDGMNVGNGGFSLRSKRLLETVSKLPETVIHPEDYVISRTCRPALEQSGIKFAAEEAANRFSIEAYGSDKFPGGNKYSGQFGFHGWGVDFSTADLMYVPRKPKNKFR